MDDIQITCGDCGVIFDFTGGEQEFYDSKNLDHPKRCKPCRDKRKGTTGRGGQMWDAVCCDCGENCQVPFQPIPEEQGGKGVRCRTCFFASRDQERARKVG